MGPSPILSFIHTITTGTMLNFNGELIDSELFYLLAERETFLLINVAQYDMRFSLICVYFHYSEGIWKCSNGTNSEQVAIGKKCKGSACVCGRFSLIFCGHTNSNTTQLIEPIFDIIIEFYFISSI